MKQIIGFKWTAKSDDDCFHDNSDRAFATQEDCYNDMMLHAVDKMKWNIEWEDVVERPVPPNEHGLITKEQTGFNIGYTLDCYPDYIVHNSYSGKYTYTIEPIEVDTEEYARLDVVRRWLTREDGEDGAILNLTQAYTKCADCDAWQKVVEEWETRVPSCPMTITGDIDELVLNTHLTIQKIADDINNKIKGAIFAETHIIAVYDIDGEQRAYTYCLGDINDCNNYFEDEEKIVTTYLLCRDKQGMESYYLQKPIPQITQMVESALQYLERNARQ